MQELKRLAALLLALVMTVSMAGCSVTINTGGDTSSDTTDSTASAAETTDGETEDAAEQEAETVEPEETEEPEEQADAVDTSGSEAGEGGVPDSLYDYTFTLDGVVYQLPFAYTELTDNGWTISSSGVNGNTSLAAYSNRHIYMWKDGSQICIYVFNMSGNVKSLRNCTVGAIEVKANTLMDANLFSFAQGITVASTEDEITSVYGAATSTVTEDEYVKSTYYRSSDGASYTTFCIYADEKTEYNSITVNNSGAVESEATETWEDVPGYLSSYVAPTELGSDVTSCVFELEGKLYQLPCPLSEFLDDGWTIESKPDSVSAGNTDYVRLTKESSNAFLTVYIANYASYQTIPENCAVYHVYAYYSENIDITLPGDLSFASDSDAVEAAVEDMFSYLIINEYSSSYSYDDTDNDIHVGIYIMSGSDMVEAFSIKRDNWSY